MDCSLEFDESDGESITPQTATKPTKRKNHQQKSFWRTTTRTRVSSRPVKTLMAERKRRKKLLQQYRALSSVLPTATKKTDKGAILEDATNYLKRLQERVNMLEEQTNKRSFAFVNETSSCQDPEREALLEIEAIAENNDVLIRIRCQNQKGCLVKILREIEKLHLTIDNFTSMLLGDYLLAITVSAQMDDEFCMTIRDLKGTLRLALLATT